MATIAIGAYMNTGTADQAMRDLIDSGGIKREWISMASSDAGGQGRRMLLEALEQRGVDRDRRELYAEALRRGCALVMADLPDDKTDAAVKILDRHDPVNVNRAAMRWRTEGWSGYQETAPPYTVEEAERERGRFTLELESVEEEVKVGKREVERGRLRVHTHVTERPVREQVELREEHATVEREPAGETLSPAEAEQAFKEESFEVTERGEEPVVSKEARVTERVRVGTEEETRTEEIKETERRKQVEAERIAGEPKERPGHHH